MKAAIWIEFEDERELREKVPRMRWSPGWQVPNQLRAKSFFLYFLAVVPSAPASGAHSLFLIAPYQTSQN